MTFIGTGVITIICALASLALMFGAGAWLAGSVFAALTAFGIGVLFKMATEADKSNSS